MAKVSRAKTSQPRKQAEFELWKRVSLASPPKRAPITYERIAQSAIKVADAEGWQAVTIRRLASVLLASPMSLYRYISSKEEIFELMVDAVQPAPVGNEGENGWRDIISAYAREARSVMLRHPWMAKLPPEASSAVTPRRLASIEAILAALAAKDIDPDTGMQIFEAVTGYVIGSSAMEITHQSLLTDRGWSKPEDVRAAFSGRMAGLLSSKKYPNYEKYIYSGKLKDNAELRFDFGLQALIEGIERKLSCV